MKLTKVQTRLLSALLQEVPDPTPDQVTQLACTLLLADQDKMEAAVSEHLRTKRQAAAWTKQLAGRMFFSFLGPLPPEKVLSESKDTKLVEKPVRPAYQVARKDFPAFVKAHGLNEKKMEQVGMGHIPEYKGWRRADHFAYGQMSLGRQYQSPSKPALVDQPADGHQETRVVFRYDPRPTVWTSDRSTD